jgi:predicted Zn-dependent protease
MLKRVFIAWRLRVVLACMVLAGWCVPLRAPLAQSVSRGVPALGDGHDMTLGAERQIGDRIVRELYRDPDYLDDAVLSEYLDGIWQALLQAARQRGELSPEMDERFAWVLLLGRDRSVNAFALPGAYFGVHLGLVAVTASRDELAAVLAHELSHVTQRHIARMMGQQARQAPWIVGAMILGAIAAAKNPEAANAIMAGGQALAVQNQLNFSRDMEREADRVGFGVLGQAGFSEAGAVGMFERLLQASRLNDNGSFPYLRSHPLTTERISDMQARRGLGGTSPEAVTDPLHALMAARARVLAQPGVDLLRAWAVEGERSLNSPLPLTRRASDGYAAALAWAQLRDLTRAQAQAERLAALLANDAAALRAVRLLQAELALRAGEPQRALAWLAPGLIAEASPSRATLLLRARAQRASGSREGMSTAAGALQTWVVQHPGDASAWQLLSELLSAQGQAVRALRAQAEVQVARLDYPAAVDRFKAAQDLARQAGAGSSADHFEASIVDARLRQVSSLLRQQALER